MLCPDLLSISYHFTSEYHSDVQTKGTKGTPSSSPSSDFYEGDDVPFVNEGDRISRADWCSGLSQKHLRHFSFFFTFSRFLKMKQDFLQKSEMNIVITLVNLTNFTCFLNTFERFFFRNFGHFFLSCHDFFHRVYVEHFHRKKFQTISQDSFTDFICTYLKG